MNRDTLKRFEFVHINKGEMDVENLKEVLTVSSKLTHLSLKIRSSYWSTQIYSLPGPLTLTDLHIEWSPGSYLETLLTLISWSPHLETLDVNQIWSEDGPEVSPSYYATAIFLAVTKHCLSLNSIRVTCEGFGYDKSVPTGTMPTLLTI